VLGFFGAAREGKPTGSKNEESAAQHHAERLARNVPGGSAEFKSHPFTAVTAEQHADIFAKVIQSGTMIAQPKHCGDPFDRMLVCKAKRLGLGIISMDTIIDAYQVWRA
jgi:hypothetical protein